MALRRFRLLLFRAQHRAFSSLFSQEMRRLPFYKQAVAGVKCQKKSCPKYKSYSVHVSMSLTILIVFPFMVCQKRTQRLHPRTHNLTYIGPTCQYYARRTSMRHSRSFYTHGYRHCRNPSRKRKTTACLKRPLQTKGRSSFRDILHVLVPSPFFAAISSAAFPPSTSSPTDSATDPCASRRTC